MKRKAYTYYTQFNRPFTTSHGTRTGTDVVILELHYDGFVGFGEASIPPYRKTDPEKLLDLLQVAPLPRMELGLDGMLDELSVFFEGRAEGLAAFDMALHDLFAKIKGQSVAALLGVSGSITAPNMYTIATNQVGEISERILEAPETDLFKVKMTGTADLELLQEIQKLSERPIFIDANQGWKDISSWKAIVDSGYSERIHGIEQPFQVSAPELSAKLTEASKIPVYADESFEHIADLEAIKTSFSGINVKLMKCGGLRNALQIIQAAKQVGLKVMLGCMSETTCGTAASLQLAPLVDLLDLDGPWLLANDPFSFGNDNGLGIKSLL